MDLEETGIWRSKRRVDPMRSCAVEMNSSRSAKLEASARLAFARVREVAVERVSVLRSSLEGSQERHEVDLLRPGTGHSGK